MSRQNREIISTLFYYLTVAEESSEPSTTEGMITGAHHMLALLFESHMRPQVMVHYLDLIHEVEWRMMPERMKAHNDGVFAYLHENM